MTAKPNEDFLKFLSDINYNSNDNKDSINPNQLFNNSYEFGYSSLTKNDSTPPLSINDSSSPESSTSNNKLDDKRKAIDEFEFDNQPNKHSNTGRRSSSGSSNDQPTSNKPKGNGGGTKRKEQNRAAQRAFRERKEKHVKDLEDKVNQQAEENSNLRDLLTRLQNENMTLKQSAFTFQFPLPNSGNKNNNSNNENKKNSDSNKGIDNNKNDIDKNDNKPIDKSDNKPSYKSPSPLPLPVNNYEYRNPTLNDLNGYGVFDDFLFNDLLPFNFDNEFSFDQPLPQAVEPPKHSTMGPPPTMVELARALANPEERVRCPQVKAKMEHMGIELNEREDFSKMSPYIIDTIKNMVQEIANENGETLDAVVRRTWKDLGKDKNESTTFDLDSLCGELTAKATCGITETECQARFLSALADRHNK